MAGYSTKNVILGAGPNAVGNSETDTVVSQEFRISEGDADNFMAKLECSGVTGTPTIKLQHSWNGDSGFEDVVGATATAVNGNVTLATTGPLWPLARIVITTDGAGAVSIAAIYASRRT